MKRALGCFVVLCSLCPAQALAQQSAAQPEPDAAPKTGGDAGVGEGDVASADGHPMAASELLRRLNEWQDTTAQLADALAEDQPFDRLSVRLQELQDALDEGLGELERAQDARPDVRRLQELEMRWREREAALARQEEEIAAALERASERLEQLTRLLDASQQTMAGWPTDVADELVRARAAAITAQMEMLRERQANQQRDLTRLQVLQDQQALRAKAAKDAIQAAEAQARQALWSRNAAPLWKAWRELKLDVEAMEARRRAILDHAADVYGARRATIGWHLLIWFVLWGGLVRAQKRGEHVWVPERQRRMVDAVMRRPRTAASLLAIALTPLLYTGTPLLIALMALATLLTLALVLVLAVRTHPVPLAVGFPYLTIALDMVRNLTENAPLDRTLLIVDLCVVTVALLHLSARERAGDFAPVRGGVAWQRILRGTAALAAALALLAALGFARLGAVVGDGLLKTLYLTIGFALAYSTGVGAGALLLTSRMATRLAAVRKRPQAAFARARLIAGLAMVTSWALAVLGVFGMRTRAMELASAMWTVQYTLGTITLSPGDLLGFIVVLVVSFELATGVHHLLADDVLPSLHLPRGVPFAIATMSRYALVATGFFIAIGAAGIEMSRLTVIFGALGVGIGFGMQTVVNNFISGLILLFERPIQVGDTVEVAGVLGSVTRIGIRSSTLRTFQGAEVLVPNADFMSQNVTNWTLSDRQRRIEVDLSVGLETDPARVIEVLRDGLSRHDDVLDQPEPAVLMRGFVGGAQQFQARLWVSGARDWVAIASELHVLARRLLVEAGIQVTLPKQELYLHGASRVPDGNGTPD